LEELVNLRRTRIESMMKILEIEGAVYKEESYWRRSAQRWEYPVERVREVTADRKAEQAAMRDYLSTGSCLMEFLRHQLDDPGAERCGRCANCAGPIFDTSVDPELVNRALKFIGGSIIEIRPRKRLPCDLQSDVNLRKHQIEAGRCLVRWGDPGLGRLVETGKYRDGRFDDRLVEAAVSLVERWGPNPAPLWLTWIPSSSDRGAVEDFARRLADTLDLEAVDTLETVRDSEPQKSMQNACQQARNVAKCRRSLQSGQLEIRSRASNRRRRGLSVDLQHRWSTADLSRGRPCLPSCPRRHLRRWGLTLTNDAMAVIALTTRLGSRERPSLTPKMWHELELALVDVGYQPVDLFDSHFDLSSVPGVDEALAQRVRDLTSDAASTTLEVAELSQKGIWTLTIADDGYPQTLVTRLGHNAPPVLFGVGDVELLARPGVGIVGSRNVSEAGADVAKEIAGQSATLELPVISGGAKGVDQLAMNEAFTAGSPVVGVLADSLIGRIRKPDVLQALDHGDICLVTQQAPSSGFTPAAAMSRNKIVYALSTVTVVVASDEGSGGTWAGAKEAIMNDNGVVAIWRGDGEGPGNAALEQLGARPMERTSQLTEFLEQLPKPSEQLAFDVAP